MDKIDFFFAINLHTVNIFLESFVQLFFFFHQKLKSLI